MALKFSKEGGVTPPPMHTYAPLGLAFALLFLLFSLALMATKS
jgi:hypothetical protein